MSAKLFKETPKKVPIKGFIIAEIIALAISQIPFIKASNAIIINEPIGDKYLPDVSSIRKARYGNAVAEAEIFFGTLLKSPNIVDISPAV